MWVLLLLLVLKVFGGLICKICGFSLIFDLTKLGIWENGRFLGYWNSSQWLFFLSLYYVFVFVFLKNLFILFLNCFIIFWLFCKVSSRWQRRKVTLACVFESKSCRNGRIFSLVYLHNPFRLYIKPSNYTKREISNYIICP